ncbi:urease [Loktanella sp. 5RATIMAR09]|uniref:DUF1272 domain-containing protein n=1 Tax=Loktanella sp. 5RATIMAR09 TaxID=1225655 RepID=UPI0007083664|nr:DUF1272 domain-containing protein [Loktanella sp. 5RATIMAR09]KQI73826.1 urease [Loktanella sp. 5RATIMAR09]
MLELRPNCEWCDKDLLPDAEEARICSYECTYCASCVSDVFQNVCPTCGGGFVPRPIRPKGAHRAGLTLGLGHQPASTKCVRSRWSAEEVAAQVARLKDIPPADRWCTLCRPVRWIEIHLTLNAARVL